MNSAELSNQESSPKITQEYQIILFDGVCTLCNQSVDFIIQRDAKDTFKFASLQSESAKNLLKPFTVNTEKLDSVLLIKNGKLYQKSSAALQIARQLSGGWKLMYGFIIIPRFLRNFVYDIIAKNRYRWFGKKETCRLPTPEERAKFLA
jgi:predicted DCC family thiol-disulfide oxidoreductase YuxK